VFASVVTTFGYMDLHRQLSELVTNAEWESAEEKFSFGTYPFILYCLFIFGMVVLAIFHNILLFIATMVGIYYLYCFTNQKYHAFFQQYQSSVLQKEPTKGISLLCQNIYFFREENYTAILAYSAMIAVCVIIIMLPITQSSEEHLVAFAAGAATIHLTLSGLRFLKLLGFSTQRDKDIFDIVSRRIVDRPRALGELLKMSQDVFDHRFRRVVLCTVVSVLFSLATTLFVLASSMLSVLVGASPALD
jgi:hypothetical protein